MFDLKKFLDVDKLKGILGKKSDAPDEQGERTENIETDEDKVDAHISQMEKEEGEEVSSEPIPFYKDRKKVIRLVVGLGVVYLIYDTFLVEKEPQTESLDVPAPEMKKNPNKRKKGLTATATEASTTTETSEVTVQMEATPVATVETTPASQIQEIPIASTPIPEVTLAVEQTPISISEDLVPSVMTPIAEVTPEVVPQPTPEVVLQTTPEISSNVGETAGQTKKEDLSSKLTEMVENEGTPAPKKMEVKAYVAPPVYETLGRGLVYNCKGRHWACVDKDSYIQCRQNEIWQKNVGKSAECSARNVYSSIDDCKIVQTHNINTAVVIDFCQ